MFYYLLSLTFDREGYTMENKCFYLTGEIFYYFFLQCVRYAPIFFKDKVQWNKIHIAGIIGTPKQ